MLSISCQISQNGQSGLNIARTQPFLKNGAANFDAKQILVGTDYSFNKQVKVYGYGGYSTFDQTNAKDKQPVLDSGFQFKL